MTPSVSKSKDVNNFEEVLKEFEEKFIAFENVYADKDELKAFIVSKLFEAEKRGEEREKKRIQKALRQLKFTGFIFQGKNWVMLTEVREKIDSLTHQKG